MYHTDFTRYAAHLQAQFASGAMLRGEAAFDLLARELFALQYNCNEPFRKLCVARGVRPDTLREWRQIPAMPTAAFKEFDVTCLLADERRRWFESSGTTGVRPSRHYHDKLSLSIYEASLWSWFERQIAGIAASCELIVLSPDPKEAPHSSLVHMFETIRRRLNAPAQIYCATMANDGSWVLDRLRCERALATVTDVPVLIMGTAFSYVHLLDMPGMHGCPLPAGSVVFETGGYKGRSRSIPKHQLHQELCGFFGVESGSILCEYGMSELSSQAYEIQCGATGADSATRAFHFPPWARPRLISPETGMEVQEGELGVIEIVDLANIASVLAVRTEDLAVKRGAGFEFRGRAAQAEPRGCSLRPAEQPIA